MFSSMMHLSMMDENPILAWGVAFDLITTSASRVPVSRIAIAPCNVPGSGFLNYINGYVTKASDAMDFTLQEHLNLESANAKWCQTYRLLCKRAPAIPEVYISLASLPHMTRSFYTDVLHPIVPQEDTLTAVDPNPSKRLYRHFLGSIGVGTTGLGPYALREVQQTFIHYVRRNKWDEQKKRVGPRSRDKITAIGINFAFELLDNFIVQFATTFFPHTHFMAFTHEEEEELMQYTKHYAGVVAYLTRLKWYAKDDDGPPHARTWFVRLDQNHYCKPSLFPLPLPGEPQIHRLWDPSTPAPHVFIDSRVHDGPVFASQEDAYLYLYHCLATDLMRRVSPNRVHTFRRRLLAIAELYRHVSGADAQPDEDENDRKERCKDMRRAWNYRAPKVLEERQWSVGQQRVLDVTRQHMNTGDTMDFEQRPHVYYIAGDPGSGKSEVLVYAAYQAAQQGATVLIMCPTGPLVHRYRDRLPPTASIVVETLHSALVIIRENDAIVRYAPPSRLRRYDIIMIDEGSQIGDAVAERLLVALAELPQKPLIFIAADFYQLNPMQGGSRMLNYCAALPCIKMETMYRTDDEELLTFLNYIRKHQPSKCMLRDFFGHGDLLGRCRGCQSFPVSVPCRRL